ncbi:MAG: rod shape-determining protein MreC [bacterium]|nr:rod shape-determining protein MreC [bacterium]
MAIFLSGAIIFPFLDGALVSMVSPVWKAENVIVRNLRNGVAFVSLQQALVEENTRLKERLSSLELDILSMSQERIQENTLLELVGRRGEFNMVVAAVLTRPPQTPYDVIIIDAGSNESITVGSRVSLPEGPALGIVSEVFSRSAKVKLFSSSGEETSAVLERNEVPIMLVGAGGGNFRMTFPRDVAIEKGDRILVADITSRLLAVVEEIGVQPTDSFKEVLAKSPTNIFHLRFVFVTP